VHSPAGASAFPYWIFSRGSRPLKIFRLPKRFERIALRLNIKISGEAKKKLHRSNGEKLTRQKGSFGRLISENSAEIPNLPNSSNPFPLHLPKGALEPTAQG
jgi:hypothetical protein